MYSSVSLCLVRTCLLNVGRYQAGPSVTAGTVWEAQGPSCLHAPCVFENHGLELSC